MKRFARLFCLCLLALLPLSAGADSFVEDPSGLWMKLKTLDGWTVVTKDNLDENMALCVARGCTEEDVRERFDSGRVLYEMYHKRLSLGCIRVEAWEDARTRNVWNMNELSSAKRKALAKEVENLWNDGLYTYKDVIVQNDGSYRYYLYAGFISNPPLRYESGLCTLVFYNGKAYMVSYVQYTDRASMRGYLKSDSRLAIIAGTGVDGHARLKYVDPILDPCADLLLSAEAYVANAHTGAFTLSGTAEKGAKVTGETGGEIFDAAEEKDGSFTLKLDLKEEGDVLVALTAKKSGMADGALSASIPVNDGAAALTLTKYPEGEMPQGKDITLSGRVEKHANVSVWLDDDPPKVLEVKDGAFTYTFQADPWKAHVLTVSASEEAKTETQVEIPFFVQYEDTGKGIAAFAKTVEKVTATKLAASPEEYVGKAVKIECNTKALTYQVGGIRFEANGVNSKKKYAVPLILKSDGYLNDQIVKQMNVTVYGYVEAPEDGLPVIRIVYISYLRHVYR